MLRKFEIRLVVVVRMFEYHDVMVVTAAANPSCDDDRAKCNDVSCGSRSMPCRPIILSDCAQSEAEP